MTWDAICVNGDLGLPREGACDVHRLGLSMDVHARDVDGGCCEDNQAGGRR